MQTKTFARKLKGTKRRRWGRRRRRRREPDNMISKLLKEKLKVRHVCIANLTKSHILKT